MEKNASEQEKELQQAYRRIRDLPDRRSTSRRDFLLRLLDVVQSPHSKLKCFAATHFKDFLKDFPDLQENVINAVYDLCEDSDSETRKRGYDAICDISDVERKWVKRNVDVLVQLLQTDDPIELARVKKALVRHMDFDTVATWGVFCDQIVPLDDPMDEDEKEMRERICRLLLTYLTTDAQPHVQRLVIKAENEAVLVEGLLRAITNLSPQHVNTIVKEILLKITTFQRGSPRCKALLDTLITRLAALRQHTPAQLYDEEKNLLDLVLSQLVEPRLVDTLPILQFSGKYLIDSEALLHFEPEFRVSAIAFASRAINVALSVHPRPEQLNFAIQTTLSSSNASTTITVLLEQPVQNDQTLSVCRDILKACKLLRDSRQLKATPWQLNSSAQDSLRQLQRSLSIAFAQDTADVRDEVQNLIRSLLEPAVLPPSGPKNANRDGGRSRGAEGGSGPSTSGRVTPSGPRGSEPSRREGSKRKLDEADLPARSEFRMPGHDGRPRRDASPPRRNERRQSPTQRGGRNNHRASPPRQTRDRNMSTPSGPSGLSTPPSRQPPLGPSRTSMQERNDRAPTASSQIPSTSALTPAVTAPKEHVSLPKRPRTDATSASRPPPAPQKDSVPSVAASVQVASSTTPTPTIHASTSLLDRLQPRPSSQRQNGRQAAGSPAINAGSSTSTLNSQTPVPISASVLTNGGSLDASESAGFSIKGAAMRKSHANPAKPPPSKPAQQRNDRNDRRNPRPPPPTKQGSSASLLDRMQIR